MVLTDIVNSGSLKYKHYIFFIIKNEEKINLRFIQTPTNNYRRGIRSLNSL